MTEPVPGSGVAGGTYGSFAPAAPASAAFASGQLQRPDMPNGVDRIDEPVARYPLDLGLYPPGFGQPAPAPPEGPQRPLDLSLYPTGFGAGPIVATPNVRNEDINLPTPINSPIPQEPPPQRAPGGFPGQPSPGTTPSLFDWLQLRFPFLFRRQPLPTDLPPPGSP